VFDAGCAPDDGKGFLLGQDGGHLRVLHDTGDPVELLWLLERDPEKILQCAVVLVHRRDGAFTGLDEARQVRLDVVLDERGHMF